MKMMVNENERLIWNGVKSPWISRRAGEVWTYVFTCAAQMLYLIHISLYGSIWFKIHSFNGEDTCSKLHYSMLLMLLFSLHFWQYLRSLARTPHPHMQKVSCQVYFFLFLSNRLFHIYSKLPSLFYTSHSLFLSFCVFHFQHNGRFPFT